MRIHSMIAATAALAVAALPAAAAAAAAATATATATAIPAAATTAAQSISIPTWAHYVTSLPPYQPSGEVSGTVTSWGHGFLKEMMRDWEQDFHRFQPNVKFQDDLASSAAAMAGLYAGRANLGVLAREIVPMEVAAYRKMTG
ncbi:MAG: hypothetical protein KGJ72_05550, partial [Gammaproteobacteria bacterium]|nr:hypothetical protein [Gammaproteobacteria bacterium]